MERVAAWQQQLKQQQQQQQQQQRTGAQLSVDDVRLVIGWAGIDVSVAQLAAARIGGAELKHVDEALVRTQLGVAVFGARRRLVRLAAQVSASGVLAVGLGDSSKTWQERAMSEWSVDDVVEWLRDAKCDGFVEACVREDISGDVLATLRVSDVIAHLGAADVGAATTLVDAVAVVRRAIDGKSKVALEDVRRLLIDEDVQYARGLVELRDYNHQRFGEEGVRRASVFLKCPITQTIMREPVNAADGFVYERFAIEAWLRRSDKSPRKGTQMSSVLLESAMTIEGIEQYLEECAGAM
jgi:hypothetical protein